MGVVIELKSEEHEFVAELLKALLDSGKLRMFPAAIEDGHCSYHCICLFEEDILNMQRENPYCFEANGWYIALGHALTDKIATVPEYTGYGDMKPWLVYEYDDKTAVVTVEEGYGLTVWDAAHFEEARYAETCIKVGFSEDSGMHLNAAYKTFRTLEETWNMG